MSQRLSKLIGWSVVAVAVAGSQAQAKRWTTSAPAGSGCKVYDVTPIIDQIDTNHDGRMTHAEWQAAGAPEPSFEMLDARHRGYVTAAQFAATKPPPGIDFNHDCKLTVDDINKLGRSMPPPGAAAPKP